MRLFRSTRCGLPSSRLARILRGGQRQESFPRLPIGPAFDGNTLRFGRS
jgi:hypothetical protein